jgi:hypothetical protein
MYTMPPITIMANMIRPVAPLRLSWRMSQIKNAISGNTKTNQKMSEGSDIFIELLNY